MKFSSNFENKLFLWMKIMIWHTFQKPKMKFPDFSLTFAPFQNFPDIISNTLTIPWPWKNKIFPDFFLTRGNPDPLILVIIYAKHGKNPPRTVKKIQDQSRKFSKICQKFKFPVSEKNVTCDTHPPMIVTIGAKYKKNPSRTVDATERTRFSKSRSNDLEDIGQGQRSLHGTHPLMLVIICAKYGKNPSGTVDATERTRFLRPRPNDLEDIGQGERSLYATHTLILVIICAKYGKNISRTVDFLSKSRPKKFKKLPKIQISRFWEKKT